MQYDLDANQISYYPKDNDGYELRKFAGAQKIIVVLSYADGIIREVMDLTFTIPLSFDTDLPNLNATAGRRAAVELPRVVVREGYQLKEIIV